LESPKIYVVTDGSYSDYGIKAVFSTMEKAEEAKRLFGSTNAIEEYELDALPDHPIGMLLYSVRMKFDGTIDDVRIADASDDSSSLEWRSTYKNHVDFTMWARDKEHATKIAIERRAPLIANGLWKSSETETYGIWKDLVEKEAVKMVSMPIEEPQPEVPKVSRYEIAQRE
jgi:hypothetical protein